VRVCGCVGASASASVQGMWWYGVEYLLALWVERFALHGYPAAVGAACFGRVDCVLCFLVTRAVEEFTRLGFVSWCGEVLLGGLARLNMSSMSAGGIVTPSFLMKRNPCVEAAWRTCSAVSSVGLERSMTGIVVSWSSV
jgi:hypothetical protein